MVLTVLGALQALDWRGTLKSRISGVFDQKRERSIMYPRLLPLPGLMLFSILSGCDLLFTWLLLQWPDGKFQESNPFASAWLFRYGWSGLIVYKAAMATTFLAACLCIAHSQPRKADRMVTVGCLLIGCVLAYSYYLIQVETH